MLKKLPPLKKFYETIEEYLKFSREQIRQHKVSFDDEEIRDVLDAMIAEQKRLAGDASVKLTDDQLAPIIIDIFTGQLYTYCISALL